MSKKAVSNIKLGLFMAVLVIFDQLSKYLATITLKGKDDFVIIKDVLVFHYLDGGNTGAAWGILSGNILFFIIFTIIAIVVISIFIRNINRIIYSNYSLKNSNLIFIKYMLAVLISGAIGNLIDRIVHRFVIDFIYFKLIDFPIFNVADCYVTISCFFIVIICLFKLKEDEFNQIFSFKFKQKNKE